MPTKNNAFRIKTSLFGDYQQYTIEDSLSGNGFSILPRFGACLTNLKLTKNGQCYPMLDTFQKPEELIGDTRCKSFFLLPFPNRLKDGKYEFEGKNYQFPIHEPSFGTSLHGFRFPLEMEIREVQLAHDFAMMRLGLCYDNQWEYYPFHFDFETQMTIDRMGQLTIGMSIRNIGNTNMPIGMGWHPYFQFGHSMTKVKMKLPKSCSLDIDDRLIPTGKKSPVTLFARSRMIEQIPVDNCFVYEGTKKRIELEFQGSHYGLRFWQETNPFQYFQLYIPPERESIAVEPMTCAPNAFQSKQGLQVLKVGEVLKGRFGLGVI